MIWKKCLVFCLIFLGLGACGARTIEETATAVAAPTVAPTAVPTVTPELRPTETGTAVPSATLTPTLTPTPTHPEYDGPTLNRSDIGVQIYLHRVDVPALVA